jgi:hypothetical protein
MRKNEPTIHQALAQAEYYKNLFNHMVDLVNWVADDERVVNYLLTLGYHPETDLVQELKYDRTFINNILAELMVAYDE